MTGWSLLFLDQFTDRLNQVREFLVAGELADRGDAKEYSDVYGDLEQQVNFDVAAAKIALTYLHEDEREPEEDQVDFAMRGPAEVVAVSGVVTGPTDDLASTNKDPEHPEPEIGQPLREWEVGRVQSAYDDSNQDVEGEKIKDEFYPNHMSNDSAETGSSRPQLPFFMVFGRHGSLLIEPLRDI